MKKKGILERLKEGPVLGDGGYLLELEKRGGVRAGPFTPEVALMYPNALRELHVANGCPTKIVHNAASVLESFVFPSRNTFSAFPLCVHDLATLRADHLPQPSHESVRSPAGCHY